MTSSEAKIVYLSDLDRCDPTDAMSRCWRRGTWRLIDYECESFAGSMLIAVEDSRPSDVTYPLAHKGWHEIYIGIYRKPFEEAMQVQVRLSDDPAFTTIFGKPGETDHAENWIDEIYWKTADLTGREIVLRQIVQPEAAHAWVACIKLVSLTDDQVRQLDSDRRRTDTKRLFVHDDGGHLNLEGDPIEIRNTLEPLREADVARLYWEGGSGDLAKRFSKLTRDPSDQWHGDPFVTRPFDRLAAKTWKSYRARNVDPFRVAAEFCKQIGVEFHAGYRPGGFVYPPPYEAHGGGFCREHTGLACVGRDGSRLPRISYAFAKTRMFVIAQCREMAADYPIDGVCMLFNRRPPLIGYETPLIDHFQKHYGKDPRTLAEDDPDWLADRAWVLTQFMTELRQAMDGLDRRLEISAVVFRPEENLQHGMDIMTWIKQGLVDTIIPYSSSHRLDSFAEAWDNPRDVKYFVQLVRGTGCKLAMNLMPRQMTPQQYRTKAHQLYESGVEHFFFWDGTRRIRDAARLGHKEQVQVWHDAGSPTIEPNCLRMLRLGDWPLDLETPG